MLIAFEGLEGVGKTTLGGKIASILTAEYLKTPSPEMNEPRGYIAKVQDPRCSFYFYLSSLYAIQARIEEVISLGKSVIVDRYLLSTIAYHDRGRKFDPPPFDSSGLRPADLSIHVRCNRQARLERLEVRGPHIFERVDHNDAAVEQFFEQHCDVEFWNDYAIDAEAKRLAQIILDRFGQNIESLG